MSELCSNGRRPFSFKCNQRFFRQQKKIWWPWKWHLRVKEGKSFLMSLLIFHLYYIFSFGYGNVDLVRHILFVCHLKCCTERVAMVSSISERFFLMLLITIEWLFSFLITLISLSVGSVEEIKDELASCRALVSSSYDKLKDELASLFFDSFQSVKDQLASSQVFFLFTPIIASFVWSDLTSFFFFVCVFWSRMSLINGSQRFRKSPLYPLENLLVNTLLLHFKCWFVYAMMLTLF